MDMEVMLSPASPNFNFDSACTTPYMTAPSSPKSIPTFFYSAPTSPSRLSAVPFNWEQKPGIPKSPPTSSNYGDPAAAEDQLDDSDTDFAFDFSGHLERTSLPADELFHAGKIKPLKPPPRFHYDQNRQPPLDSPKSPRSPKSFIRDAFSPKSKTHQIDPFTAALEHTQQNDPIQLQQTERRRSSSRGRERTVDKSNSRNKNNSRSLSPFRVSDLLFDPETDQTTNQEKPKNSASSSTTTTFSSFWYKKWKIKDLLLFRSASESRAKDKEEELKKYAQLKKPREYYDDDDVKNSSFRSTDSGSSRRRTGAPISAHELHYTVNRAFSEEMRKRTSLPYRQGFLGCLGFHPEISKGFTATGSSSRTS